MRIRFAVTAVAILLNAACGQVGYKATILADNVRLPVLAMAADSHSGTSKWATGLADSLKHLLREPHSGFLSPLRAVATDTATFRRLWSEAVRGAPEARAMPQIDFDRDMVIVAAMGGEPSTGFAIAIDSVVARGQSVEVHVLLGSSGNLCAQGQAFTSPVDIVQVPKRLDVVVFRDRHVVSQCRMP